MDNQTKNNSNEELKKLGEKIKDIRIAMLTTLEDDGSLRSRPMATQQTEFDGTLWFFTKDNSPKVAEVAHDQHVNLSYAKPDDELYISISGTARIVRDKQKVKELWNPFVKAWFPKGPEDPELVLLRVDPGQAEYWDSPSGTMVQLYGLVKAVVTGKPPTEATEHKKVSL